jgi:hypothetical protein
MWIGNEMSSCFIHFSSSEFCLFFIISIMEHDTRQLEMYEGGAHLHKWCKRLKKLINSSFSQTQIQQRDKVHWDYLDSANDRWNIKHFLSQRNPIMMLVWQENLFCVRESASSNCTDSNVVQGWKRTVHAKIYIRENAKFPCCLHNQLNLKPLKTHWGWKSLVGRCGDVGCKSFQNCKIAVLLSSFVNCLSG